MRRDLGNSWIVKLRYRIGGHPSPTKRCAGSGDQSVILSRHEWRVASRLPAGRARGAITKFRERSVTANT